MEIEEKIKEIETNVRLTNDRFQTVFFSMDDKMNKLNIGFERLSVGIENVQMTLNRLNDLDKRINETSALCANRYHELDGKLKTHETLLSALKTVAAAVIIALTGIAIAAIYTPGVGK
jgi:hypothetical protein